MDFDAHIIGIPDFIRMMKQVFGRDEARFQERKFHHAEKLLVNQISEDQRLALKALFRKSHEPCCHIHLERAHFLKALDDWLGRHKECPAPALRTLGHVDALILPLDLPTTHLVEVAGRHWPLPVTGAAVLKDELQQIAEVMDLNRFFQSADLGDFIHFEREALKKTTSKHFLGESFWPRFAVLVLRHLVTRCLATGLPLVVADRTLKPA